MDILTPCGPDWWLWIYLHTVAPSGDCEIDLRHVAPTGGYEIDLPIMDRLVVVR